MGRERSHGRSTLAAHRLQLGLFILCVAVLLGGGGGVAANAALKDREHLFHIKADITRLPQRHSSLPGGAAVPRAWRKEEAAATFFQLKKTKQTKKNLHF